LAEALDYWLAGDRLLLVEDAVYCLQTQAGQALLQPYSSVCYALSADIDARAVNANWLAATQQVDFGGFVDLTAQATRSLTWQ